MRPGKVLQISAMAIVMAVLFCKHSNAQNVAVTDNDSYNANSSAMLDVYSLSKGFLAPRLTTAQRTAIAAPAAGLMVFDTDLSGYYFYNGSVWINLSTGTTSGPFWSYSSPNVYLTNSNDFVGLGTSSPYHKLHIVQNINITDGTDGNFIDIQNTYTGTGAMCGLRLTNGSSGTPHVFKGAIFYKDAASYNRGDLIFANRNTADYNSVTSEDARMVIKSDGSIQIKGDVSAANNDALFHVENSSGDTVFAVYPFGVRIYVGDNTGAKNSRGGFAVGGFSQVKGLTNEYLHVSPDSVRVYIQDDYVKANGNRGGFAVGGFSQVKGYTDNYLYVTDDSTRVWTYGDGGFEIADIQTSDMKYLDVTPKNYFIGHYSGIARTSGLYNVAVGYRSAQNLNTANYNTFLGYYSGYNTTTGSSNIIMGYRAGYSLVDGSNNTVIGNEAGYSNVSASYNVYIGRRAGRYNASGGWNLMAGSYAGENSAGHENVFLGLEAGRYATGDNNVFIGSKTGSNNTGSFNVFIGNYAATWETGSNKLYIENSNSSTPLIYGEFDNDLVRINGNLEANGTYFKISTNPGGGATPTNYAYQGAVGSTAKAYAFSIKDALWVTSNAWVDGNITCTSLTQTSDKRLKKNIVPIDNALQKALSLQGVYFDWNEETAKLVGHTDARQIGFIAQEVEKILPELVIEDESGYKSVSYAKTTALIIEALKEQQKLIEELTQRLDESESANQKLKAQIEK